MNRIGAPKMICEYSLTDRFKSFGKAVALTATALLANSVRAQVPSTPPIGAPLETHHLDNGLSVILAPDRSTPIVAIAVSYRAGVADEDPGRSEFSHLFEHLMSDGPRGEHQRRIQEVGGRGDATTDFDQTHYYQQVPSNYLETVLWLESDRMGFMLPAITQEHLELQRSVVQNEHRQRRENVPYGMAFWETLGELYAAGHPYSLPDGWIAELEAATVDDARSFFSRLYGPNNATLAIVGDFAPQETLRLVERYFGEIPAVPRSTPPSPQPIRLDDDRYVVLEDRVELPALFVTWPTGTILADGEPELHILAEVLAGGRNSRLHRRLVDDEAIARTVSAGQESWALSGQFMLSVIGMPGQDLNVVRARIDDEVDRLLGAAPPMDDEVTRAVNTVLLRLASRHESRIQRAQRLARLHNLTGDPGFAAGELDRYASVTPATVAAVAARYLGSARVVLSVVPEGMRELSVAP